MSETMDTSCPANCRGHRRDQRHDFQSSPSI